MRQRFDFKLSLGHNGALLSPLNSQEIFMKNTRANNAGQKKVNITRGDSNCDE